MVEKSNNGNNDRASDPYEAMRAAQGGEAESLEKVHGVQDDTLEAVEDIIGSNSDEFVPDSLNEESSLEVIRGNLILQEQRFNKDKSKAQEIKKYVEENIIASLQKKHENIPSILLIGDDQIQKRDEERTEVLERAQRLIEEISKYSISQVFELGND